MKAAAKPSSRERNKKIVIPPPRTAEEIFASMNLTAAEWRIVDEAVARAMGSESGAPPSRRRAKTRIARAK